MSRVRVGLPNLLQRPVQGWASLLLLLAMLGLVGASVADARLLELGTAGRSSSLMGLLIAGGLIGFVLARSTLGVVRAHIIGAAIGASLILLVAGAAVQDRNGVLPSSWPDLQATMTLLYQHVQEEIRSVDQVAGSVPVAVFLLFGALCWTTAQFSAFSIFRYDRGGPAMLAIGVVLFLPLLIASWRSGSEPPPMLPQLALFAALAMLLLMRMQLTQQRERWARRHISDAGEVSRLFLRSGALFVAFTVAGASTLAATTGPHQLETGGLDDTLEDVGRELSRWLPFLPVLRQRDQQQSLGDSFEIPDSWDERQGTAFTAVVDGDLAGNYWTMSAHDLFNGWTWDTSDGGSTSLEPGEEFEVTPGFGGERPLGATILVDALEWPRTITSPAEPYAVTDVPLELRHIDGNAGVGRIDLANDEDADDPYRVDAFVWDYGDGPGALTRTQLRKAGTEYPEWTDRYLQGVDEDATSGTRTQRTADRIFDRHDNPYDRAIDIQNHLRGMDYTTENLATICAGLNVPECVLEYRQGFCLYYASTMVMVLREMGIPSRMVRGFLPGEPTDEGSWVVPNAAFHAWSEAFFPGFGWIRFDPTPPTPALEAVGQQPTNLDDADSERRSGPEPTQRPQDGPEPTDFPEPSPTFGPSGEGGPAECTEGCDDALAGLLVGGGIAGLMLVVIGGLLLYRVRRGPMTDEGAAYRALVRLATRLGHGPHPAQTEYEYAASLSVTLPQVRDDLYLVAASRVESRYGQHTLDGGRHAALKRAYIRIRTALLRLSIRARRGG